MSLKIWITGNGNINNQGTLGELTQVTAPTYVDGKMGKAVTNYKLTMDGTQTPEVLNNDEFSYCTWLYPNDDTGTTGTGYIFGNSGSTVNSPGSTARYSIRNGSTINDLIFHTLTTNTTANSGHLSLTGVLPSYTWTHVAISYKKPNLTLYINGEVAGTTTFYMSTTQYGYTTPIANITSRMYQNDLRVYNHALSKKEIHEIYKSLILHYPLNNPFGNPNLIPNTFDLNGLSLSPGGSITDEYYRGFRVLKCNMPASSSDSYQDACGFSVPVEPSTTYTLSFYYKGWSFESFFHPSTVASGKNNTGGTTTRVDGCITTPSNDMWKKYTITWTTLSTVASGTSKRVIPVRLNRGDTDRYGYLCGIKFEKGDTATPWCPNSADEEYSLLGLDSNIIADCSGYDNDGKSTIYPALATITHSPRYSSSIWYGASDYINCGSNTKPTDEITVSMWAYKTDWSTIAANINKLISNTHNGGWNIILHQSRSYAQIYINGAYVTADISPTITSITPGWHMFTFTYDGYQLKSYFDGEIYASSTATTNKNPIDYGTNNTATFVNAEAGADGAVEATNADSFIYSDIRIYATALTAEDIKELYQTPFFIDKNGNVFGYNFMEV